MKFFYLLLLILIAPSLAISQSPDSLWNRTLGGSNNDWCHSIAQTSDGGYILTGTTYSFGAGGADFWLVKTDADGDSLRSRTFGGNNLDMCYSTLQTADGGYMLAGKTRSFGAGVDDFWLVKADADGDSLWSRSFGGSDYDWCRSVVQTSDNGYIMGGWTSSFGAGGRDCWLVRTDANGDSLWSRTFGGNDDDGCYSIQQTSDGGYILAGYTSSFSASSRDFWLVKTDTDGDSLWSRTFGGSDWDECRSVQQTPDSGYILAGNTWSFGAGNQDFWLLKTDSLGTQLWNRTFGGSDWDECYCVQQALDSGYVLTGVTRSYGAGDDDFWLVRTNANGDSLWSRTFGGSGLERCNMVQQTIDSSYILAGYTETFGAGESDFWLVKTGQDPVFFTPPDSFDLISPADADTVWTLIPTIDWEDAADSDPGDIVNYVLYWSQDSLFAEADSVVGLTESEYTFTLDYPLLPPPRFDDLPDDVVIYWKVRAVDSYRLSRWSNQLNWNFQVYVMELPDSFNLIAPEDEDMVWTLMPTVDWEDATDPDPGDNISYVLYWSQDSMFAEADSIVGLTESEYTFSDDYPLLPPPTLDDLPDDVVIYWKVRAVDSYRLSRWSNQLNWNFHVYLREPPGEFTLVTPANGNTIASLATDFAWQTASDPDPNDTVTYCLYLSTDSTFAAPDSVCLLTDTIYRWDGLLDNQEHWWKVKATDSFGLFTWSNETWNFTVFIPEPPSPFNLLAPEDGALLEPGIARFIWESSIDPDPGDTVAYTLHFLTNEDSVSYAIGSNVTIQVAPDTVDVLTPGGDATWFVTARSSYPDTIIESAQRFTFTASAAEGVAQLPREFRLYQNYPNPFNPTTVIQYDVPKTSSVKLHIFDLLGRQVRTLVDEIHSPGTHSATFNASGFASGIYLYQLQAGDFVTTKKMVVLK